MSTIPQVIPYQGSKRKIAPLVLENLPKNISVFYEPFAGSAAVTLAVAKEQRAKQYVINDILAPLADLWRAIIQEPQDVVKQYQALWEAQIGDERRFYDKVRAEFNKNKEPAKLLYLIARCVKNSVRFNSAGEFNQSPDNRRKGMQPSKMAERIPVVSKLLKGRAETSAVDFREVTRRATKADFVYMDPPYQGTSSKKDTRYAQQLKFEDLVEEMEKLNARGVPFILSYDGMCGEKSYGKKMPKELGLSQIFVHVGRSSQATLLGREDDTVESLYLSPALTAKTGGCVEVKKVY